MFASGVTGYETPKIEESRWNVNSG